MRVLVASAGYPIPNGARSMFFVHSRNLYYVKNGIEVTVLSFSAKESYIIDDIRVITLQDFVEAQSKYDLLIMHAPNIRFHYRFLKKYGHNFEKKVFVFHGHEVLHINKYYPKPYDFLKKYGIIKKLTQQVYDDFKLKIWHRYYLGNIESIRLIFVSNWIFQQFKSELKIDETKLMNHAYVISNSIGEYFEKNKYCPQNVKYDFITIRSNMDDSTYGVDIVVDIAKKHPEYRFCIIGKGRFFEFYNIPDNVEWINGEMTHNDIMTYINQSKYALLPTREDTQGLMACEMVSCGIPLITSDIEVCREVFSDCPLVELIDNEKPLIDEAVIKLEGKADNSKEWDRYFARNTILKEIEFLKKYYENQI